MILVFAKYVNMLDTFDCDSKDPELRYKAVYVAFAYKRFRVVLQTTKCPNNSPNNRHLGSDTLELYAKYRRSYIWDFVNGELVLYRDVHIWRCQCSRDDSTHAILLWLLPPYSRHTYRVILSALYDCCIREITIEKICEKYDITEKTLSDWRKKFERDYRPMCRLLPIVISEHKRLLEILIAKVAGDDPSLFEEFYKTNGYAFLQRQVSKPSEPRGQTPETNSTPNQTNCDPASEIAEEIKPTSNEAAVQIDPVAVRADCCPSPFMAPVGVMPEIPMEVDVHTILERIQMRPETQNTFPEYLDSNNIIFINIDGNGLKRHGKISASFELPKKGVSHSSPWTGLSGGGSLNSVPRGP